MRGSVSSTCVTESMCDVVVVSFVSSLLCSVVSRGLRVVRWITAGSSLATFAHALICYATQSDTRDSHSGQRSADTGSPLSTWGLHEHHRGRVRARRSAGRDSDRGPRPMIDAWKMDR